MHGDVTRLGPEIAKNKDGRVPVIVGEIVNIIARRQMERVELCSYVFHWEAKRIKLFIIAPGGRHGRKMDCRDAACMMRGVRQ